MSALALLLLLPAADDALVAWAGHLRDGGVPVEGPVSAVFTITLASGPVARVQEEPVLDVVAGNFVVDLFVPLSDEALTLGIVIDGTDLGTMPLPVESARALNADDADAADSADDAGAVAGIADLVSDDALAAGDVPVAFANLVNVPAEFQDGDFGIDFVPFPFSFTFVDGVLALAPGAVSSIHLLPPLQANIVAANAVTTNELVNNAVTTAAIADGTLPLTKIAAGALDTRHLTGNITSLFEVTDARHCDDEVGIVTESPTCTFSTTSSACVLPLGGIGHRDCDDVCVDDTSFQCPNSPLGALVFR